METAQEERLAPRRRRPNSPPRDSGARATLKALKSAGGELRLLDLANLMNESRQATAYRLRCLKRAGKVSDRREGLLRLWRAL